MKTGVEFDYESLDKETQKTARKAVSDIGGLLITGTKGLLAVGERLAAVRDAMPQSFALWCRCELSFGKTTAFQYISCYERFGGVECIDKMHPAAVKKLSAKSVSQRAVDSAIKMASGGEVVSGTIASRLIKKFSRKRNPTKAATHSFWSSIRRIETVDPDQLLVLADELYDYVDYLRSHRRGPKRRRVAA